MRRVTAVHRNFWLKGDFSVQRRDFWREREERRDKIWKWKATRNSELERESRRASEVEVMRETGPSVIK